jgi:hypothetical protein
VKSNANKSKKPEKTLQVWTYEQARSVIPYVRSVMTSLRDFQIEAQMHSLEGERLSLQPGRLDRARILAHQEALQLAAEARESFNRALDDLHVLDIHCLSAMRGLALIPFVHDSQLAWHIFDLFAAEPLQYWRYHYDKADVQRPIAEVLEAPTGSNYVV